MSLGWRLAHVDGSTPRSGRWLDAPLTSMARRLAQVDGSTPRSGRWLDASLGRGRDCRDLCLRDTVRA
jgi:hypothetical protein